jgi:tetratricopeptide (TPR) repeat protein
MTLEDALQELGIDAAATPEEARRAYLRGIKIRKPETDPEGFRRIREAYEIVTGALSQPQMEPDPSPEEEEERAEVPPELAMLAARLKDLPAETHLEERLAALREAIREHPQSLGLRWWLIQELGRAGRREEVLEALREGEADRLPGFLEARAANFPESIVDLADLERLGSSHSPDVLALAARVYMTLGQFGKAAAVLGRAIDRVAEWSDPALHPVPEWLPHGILMLEAQGSTADARELHHRVWGWLSGTGDAALLKRWGAELSWRLVHELGELHLAFPPELRQEAARAALSGNTAPAIEEAKLLQTRDSKRAEQAAAMLYDLPILYDLYFRLLQGVGPGQKPQVVQEPSHFSRFISYAFLLVLLFGLQQTYCPRSPPVPAALEIQATMHDKAQAAWNALEAYSCDPKGRKLPQKACDAARLSVERARADDCPGAHAALDEMSAQLQGPRLTVPDLVAPRVFQTEMLSALDTGCGAYQLRTEGRAGP